MRRTTIMLPDDLKFRAEKQALDQGKSLGEIIRDSLGEYLAKTENGAQRDSLADPPIYRGKVPKDGAARHDEYLYSDKP
jgi:hypothetical protein